LSVIVAQLALIIVRMPEALVAVCPSGFVTVMVREPGVAVLATVRFNVMLVGLVYVMLLTVTPVPFTLAEILFVKPVPGSKKPEPETEVPVNTTLTLETLVFTLTGEVLAGVAGGGARS
jgi:hypothetical protein